MYDIIIIFNDDLKITSNNIINIILERDNNNQLKVSILIPKKLYSNKVTSIINCKILINDKEYFNGIIKSIQIENDCVNIIAIHNNNMRESNIVPSNLIEKFRLDNPSLFQKRNNFSDYNNINNIENIIVNNSLKITIDKLLPITELDLLISASWNKLCNGYCNLTNKIKSKLKNGLISTITPKKLLKSWPKLFDKLITNNRGILKTKYFVSYSKLEEYTNNIIKVNENNITETLFDFKLSIGWEYYQFITENLHCKIINNEVKNNTKQLLHINLHNVQEYIENMCSDSFFKSKIGNTIFNIILCEIKQFIINSMQNITIQFQIPFSENFKVNQTIKIGKYICIINKIELLFIRNKNIATITCISSEYNNAFTNATLSDMKIYDKNNNDEIMDVVENINIINTSYDQLNKIKNIKDNKKINDILNENATKLLITLKPIKTEHNKIENIDIGNINLL